MNKMELAEKVAFEVGLTKKAAEKIVGVIFQTIEDALMDGENVCIRDFCSFRVSTRTERQITDPDTGEMMRIPEGRRVKVKMAERIVKQLDPEADDKEDNVNG